MMSMRVDFGWGPEGAQHLAAWGDVAVIVDVLSFSTAVEVAVSRGASVYPYRWDQEAVEYARSLGAILANPRRVASLESPYSLSASSLLSLPPGSRLVLPSPNGSTITAAVAQPGTAVLAGCLRNAQAVAEAAHSMGERITVIAAGERWPNGALRPSLEDLVGAGAILSHFERRGLSADARAAVAAYGAARLPDDIWECASGQELVQIGRGEDVRIAAEVDASNTVPVIRGGAYVRLGDT